uniref:Uncharacterized protein n=1 Tax=Schizaphis graminum TaxID=13262 RepID=A0A2S2NSX5_SCHGA
MQESGIHENAYHGNDILHLEVEFMDLVFLVGVFLTLVIFIGFYAFIYIQSDLIKRVDENITQRMSVNKISNDHSGRRRWFQPFFYFNNTDDPTTEWMGDWVSVCSSISDDEMSR